MLRGDLVTRTGWGRSLLAVGFVAMATAAFLHGSLVVDDSYRSTVAAIRAAGVLAVVAGSLSWNSSRLSRAVLWLGLAATAVGIAFGVQGSETGTSTART